MLALAITIMILVYLLTVGSAISLLTWRPHSYGASVLVAPGISIGLLSTATYALNRSADLPVEDFARGLVVAVGGVAIALHIRSKTHERTFGRYGLFRILNYSPGNRVLLSLTSSYLPQYSYQLSPAYVLGKDRIDMNHLKSSLRIRQSDR